MRHALRVGDEEVASRLKEILKSVMNKKSAKDFFNTPVDFEKLRLNEAEYRKIIKSPMDLGTVHRTLNDDAAKKFDDKTYQYTQEFAHDVRLVRRCSSRGCDAAAAHWPWPMDAPAGVQELLPLQSA